MTFTTPEIMDRDHQPREPLDEAVEGHTNRLLRDLLSLSPWDTTSDDVQALQRRARFLLGMRVTA